MNLGKDIGVKLGARVHGQIADTLTRIQDLHRDPAAELIEFSLQSAHEHAAGGIDRDVDIRFGFRADTRVVTPALRQFFHDGINTLLHLCANGCGARLNAFFQAFGAGQIRIGQQADIGAGDHGGLRMRSDIQAKTRVIPGGKGQRGSARADKGGEYPGDS